MVIAVIHWDFAHLGGVDAFIFVHLLANNEGLLNSFAVVQLELFGEKFFSNRHSFCVFYNIICFFFFSNVLFIFNIVDVIIFLKLRKKGGCYYLVIRENFFVRLLNL